MLAVKGQDILHEAHTQTVEDPCHAIHADIPALDTETAACCVFWLFAILLRLFRFTRRLTEAGSNGWAVIVSASANGEEEVPEASTSSELSEGVKFTELGSQGT